MGQFFHDWAFDKISNALFKGGKSSLPIRSARRSMPFAAFGLKKYFCGTSPVSMSSNNEDSLTRLGDSEVFAVKHTPSQTIPEFGQSSNDDLEVSPFVRREKPRNVFDDENSGAALFNQASKFMKESRLLSSKPSSRTHSGERNVLAGKSSSPHIAYRESSSVDDFFDVRRTGDGRPVFFEDRRAVFVAFTLESNVEALLLERKIESSNSGEK